MSRRRRLEPFEGEILRLAPRGLGEGVAPDGRPFRARAAPPGARVALRPSGLRKGVWSARRTGLVRPAVDAAVPPCPAFGLCGGCVLQELALDAQRREKAALALRQVEAAGALPDVPRHPVRGAPDAFGYRNKMELSFGTARYVAQADHDAGAPLDGRFLGLHAPGRFDRIVDLERCWLMDEAANQVLARVRAAALAPDAPPPYDPRAHTGFWRHLIVRSSSLGEVLVALNTTSEPGAEHVAALAEALCGAELGGKRVVGVTHLVSDGVADVAKGAVQRVWGAQTLRERLGPVELQLSLDAFFQTNTAGAEVLLGAVREALGDASGTLLDLYCGTGSLGLALAGGFERVLGVEVVEAAVADARANAAHNQIGHAEFRAAPVEGALDVLDAPVDAIIVDPPRAGLHPSAARALATARADVLVYVACNPASLARDLELLRQGGWRIAALWTVDLFPQTGHIEIVARMVRP